MLKVSDVSIPPRLNPISFELNPGEIRVITGKSGAGKSVLLRALADLTAHEGQVWLDKTEQQQTRPDRWRQNVMWFSAETAWWLDTIGEHFNIAQNSAKNDQAWLYLALKSLHLEPSILQKLSRDCSSGEKQRLALLRGLSQQPRVLLLDEITANLDNETAQAVETFIQDYVTQHPACALWVTHDSAQQNRLAAFSQQPPIQLTKP